MLGSEFSFFNVEKGVKVLFESLLIGQRIIQAKKNSKVLTTGQITKKLILIQYSNFRKFPLYCVQDEYVTKVNKLKEHKFQIV